MSCPIGLIVAGLVGVIVSWLLAWLARSPVTLNFGLLGLIGSVLLIVLGLIGRML